MDIQNIKNASEQLAQVLMLAAQQKGDIAGKLIRMNIETAVFVDKPDDMGLMIDLYA
ncbi:MAG: hypothetical protein JW881_13040 [Spirochaetales bacterium]|nr:hypothetical protein [Spirochaetales bacterium]